MKQTAVEFLVEQIKSKADNLPTNTKENRMAKGIYVDCLIMARQAKENEEQQQVYNEEEVLNIIDNFCETFKVDLILREDFNQWFEQFKSK